MVNALRSLTENSSSIVSTRLLVVVAKLLFEWGPAGGNEGGSGN